LEHIYLEQLAFLVTPSVFLAVLQPLVAQAAYRVSTIALLLTLAPPARETALVVTHLEPAQVVELDLLWLIQPAEAVLLLAPAVSPVTLLHAHLATKDFN
jgi:hypothetical protein